AMGQAARESEGWENVLGNLREQWKQLLAVVGQPALKIAISTVRKMTSALENLTEKIRPAVNALMELFGMGSAETAEISGNIAESTANQESLTEAVEATEKAQEGSLAAFDKINTISSGTNDDISEDSPHTTAIVPVVDETPVEKAIDRLAEKFRHLLMPVKIAWEDNSPELIANAEYAVNAVKSLFSDIGRSIAEVWENGSGEEFAGNIIRLFGDILGIIGDIATALQNAWDDGGRGESLVQSYFDRWNSLLELIHVVSDAFREVWNNGTGEEICGNILGIWTNINETVANLRTNFADSWSENEAGEKIIQVILDLFKVISDTSENITFSASEWAENVDFSPFLESVGTLLESLEPLAENIGEGLEDFLNGVLLPLASWTIEDLIPAFLDALSEAIEGVNSAWETAEPVVKDKLWEKFLKPIAKWSGDTATKALEALGSAIKKIGESITAEQVAAIIDLAGGILALIGAAKGFEIVSQIAAALSGLGPAITGAIEFLGGAATASLGTVFAGIAAFIAGFSLTTAFLDAFGLTEVLEKIGENIYDFIHVKMPEFVNNISEFLGGFLSSIVSGDWEEVVAYCKAIPDKIKAFFGENLANIQEIFAPLDEWFKEQFQEAWDNIKLVWSVVKDWFGKRWNDVKSVFSAVGSWFKNKFQTAWDNIAGIFGGFSGWFAEKWDKIKSVFSETGQFFKEKFNSAWNNIKEVFNSPSSFFNSVWTAIKGCFSHVSEWFRTTFSEAWQAVKNVFSKGGEIFNGISDSIAETFKGVVNSLIDGINWVIAEPFKAINWAFDGLRDIEILDWYPFEWLPSLTIPEIPKLAQGTVVPANYGEFMAILGDNRREAEVVSPISTIEKAVRNAMKNGGNFPEQLVVNTYLFPNSTYFNREVIRIVNADSRKRGG
ncbi:MAG: hypothetical protein NC489_26570, partial [Ruminococcus flavefaciens]|nr:hypothetical protein [Ruminococcus flavefaciens]